MPDMKSIKSPIIFQGDETRAYRDPAIYHDGTKFHLFFTLVENEADGPYLFVAKATSTDLIHWSEPRILTEKNRAKNYSSPGNVIRFGGKYLLSLQTYPRENGEKYGNLNARVYVMESDDLENFDSPRMLMVKGNIPVEDMGRMIDPYLIEDLQEPGKWWCTYKQNGVSTSWSYDLVNWTYAGHTDGGENVCIFPKDGQYIMYHSPDNGIGVKTSPDLHHWTDHGILTLGQAQWPWAQGRITAGAVLDISHLCGEPMYIMVFHGSGPENEEVYFDTFASLGIAYSRDLTNWEWNKLLP